MIWGVNPGDRSGAWRLGFIASIFFLFAAVGRDSPAAPITFNTALPVAQGEGIFRFQFKTLKATEDPGVLDRDLKVLATPLVGVFGATRRVALFAIVPLLDKSLDVTTPMGRRTRAVSGLGDVTLLARYTAYQRDAKGSTLRIAPFLGVETPTGQSSERDALGKLPKPLQLGSGSWDILVGAVVTRQTLAWQLDGSLTYKANSEANGFEFGDVARLDLSYQRRLWPRELGDGTPAFVYGVLESNLVASGRNLIAGLADPDSGGTTWFLAPGVQFVTRRMVVEGAVQIPVMQNLDGSALETDFIATLSVRMNF